MSSKHVNRSFCKTCGTPMTFETSIFPTETHFYAQTLDTPEKYTPQAHLFWSEKVPWLSMSDDLPKYPKGLQDAAQNGKTLL